MYNKLVQESLAEIEKLSGDENGKRLGIILSTITRLKQICNHPGNYSQEFAELDSGKLIKLKEIVKEVKEKKEKIIIFTQYVAMANILADNFENSLIFHGGLNIKERLETLQAFKTDGVDILIISLKAGGTGLNIVEANHVVHYDLWYNPAVENQATDRAYRRGQTKDVFVSRFISKGTFEEKINDLLFSKQDLFDKTMNNQGLSHLSRMNNDELKDIFSFGSK
jgi:SNF2 family DNA or RNA helicase